MTRYEYEASWGEEIKRGTVDAKTQAEARVKVKNLGYKLVYITGSTVQLQRR